MKKIHTMHQFKVGDYASTCPLSDHHPVVVTHVSPSGKTVRVRSVRFTIKPGRAEMWRHYGLEDVDIEGEGGLEETYKFTTRKRGGAAFRGPGGRLTPGFCSYYDPHY